MSAIEMVPAPADFAEYSPAEREEFATQVLAQAGCTPHTEGPRWSIVLDGEVDRLLMESLPHLGLSIEGVRPYTRGDEAAFHRFVEKVLPHFAYLGVWGRSSDLRYLAYAGRFDGADDHRGTIKEGPEFARLTSWIEDPDMRREVEQTFIGYRRGQEIPMLLQLGGELAVYRTQVVSPDSAPRWRRRMAAKISDEHSLVFMERLSGRLVVRARRKGRWISEGIQIVPDRIRPLVERRCATFAADALSISIEGSEAVVRVEKVCSVWCSAERIVSQLRRFLAGEGGREETPSLFD